MRKRKSKAAGDKITGSLLIGLSLFTLIDNLINLSISAEYFMSYIIPNVIVLVAGVIILFSSRIVLYLLYICSIIAVYSFNYEIPLSEILAGYSITIIAFTRNKTKIIYPVLFVFYIGVASLIGAYKGDPQDVIISRILIIGIVSLIIYRQHFTIRTTNSIEIDKNDIALCKLIISGKTEKEIASELHTSKSTITRRIKELRESAGVQTTSDLRILLVKHGNI